MKQDELEATLKELSAQLQDLQLEVVRIKHEVRYLKSAKQVAKLKTPEAVRILGRTKSQLLRLVEAGHLQPGIHYFRGAFRNSPITWDVEACQQRFAELAHLPVPLPGEAA